MQVVNKLKKKPAEFTHSNVETGSANSSDAYRSYNHLKTQGYKLNAKEFNPKEDKELNA